VSSTDWGASDVRVRGKNPAAFAAAPIGVAVLVAAVMGSIFLGTWGIVIGALIVGAVIVWVLDQPRRCLARAGAVPLDNSTYPRPSNIVEGLAPRVGVPAPELYLIEDGGPNALTSSRHGGTVAMTRALLDHYSRTELEAVLAHCLVRLQTGAIQRATMRLSFGPLGQMSIEPVGWGDDVATAAATRYPPALASAIEKADPRTGSCGPLWFVPATPAGRTPAERVDAIADL
jgi:hypothetical protein